MMGLAAPAVDAEQYSHEHLGTISDGTTWSTIVWAQHQYWHHIDAELLSMGSPNRLPEERVESCARRRQPTNSTGATTTGTCTGATVPGKAGDSDGPDSGSEGMPELIE